MSSTIYLDNSATTPLCPEALTAMMQAMGHYGNPSSLHSLGQDAHTILNRARAQVGAALGVKAVKPNELIFTSCGTESDNAAVWSALLTNPERRKVIASKVEHPAILNLGRELERRGYIFETIPVDSDGRIDLAALEEAVDENFQCSDC